jgi:hypothetical protein
MALSTPSERATASAPAAAASLRTRPNLAHDDGAYGCGDRSKVRRELRTRMWRYHCRNVRRVCPRGEGKNEQPDARPVQGHRSLHNGYSKMLVQNVSEGNVSGTPYMIAPCHGDEQVDAPPSSVMNSRLFIRSPRRRAAEVTEARQGRVPWRSLD